MEKVKKRGEIFTPNFLVKNMLNLLGYEKEIIRKHILDNSCGDGAFLGEIVKRYSEDFFAKNSQNPNKNQLKNELEKYIHGIEINEKNAQKCRENLDKIAAKFGIKNVNWNIEISNALTSEKFNKKMDFVVANPPYVRVHNLRENLAKVKNARFCENGMTDLFIAFFEIGFCELNSCGKMIYVTPSSWFSSKSGTKLREYIFREKNLTDIVDLAHFQAFENATTYSAIAKFDRETTENFVNYFTYDSRNKKPVFREKLNYEDFYFDGKFNFNSRENLQKLREMNETSRNISAKKIEVKNGFATLADKIFIGDFDFGENSTIPILKASTGKLAKIIFPYDKNSRPITEKKFAKKFPKTYKYLLSRKNDLLKRNIAKPEDWFLFGRTQALNDVFKRKIAINTTIKNRASLKIREVPAGTGIYSGLYILTDLEFAKIREILDNENFINYIESLKKYKSGGYYTFSSNDLKKFLLYNIIEEKNLTEEIYEQRNIFDLHKSRVPSLS